ncbi:Uncharacterised protein [Vibrio cholerae]|uniref:Uncharacterized protein n=1 Tax=Vibrio cholerae TaxID=666 RepID=A0A655VFV6_VIBCL|nr:Uncharacterised protein [Vibrio cholerae]
MGILHAVIRPHHLWNAIKVNDFARSFPLHGRKTRVFGWVPIFGGNHMFKERKQLINHRDDRIAIRHWQRTAG